VVALALLALPELALPQVQGRLGNRLKKQVQLKNSGVWLPLLAHL